MMKARMLTAGSIVAATMLVSPAALAGDFDYLDFYYVNTEVDADPGGDDDGDGFGIKGQAHFAENLTFHGEYQASELDDSNTDVDQLRFGAGIHGNQASQFQPFGKLEYVSIDLDGDDDTDGIGIHGGALLQVNPQFHLIGSIGYLGLDDVDGFEVLVGGNVQLAPAFGLFLEYRTAMLEVDAFGDPELDVNDLRLGGRWHFDAAR